MARLTALLVGFLFLTGVTTLPADAARRAALVVGVNEYDEVQNLEKAVGDARAMAAKLRQLGFEVTEVLDPDRRAFNQSISQFAATLASGDTAFVHFSGHGVEIDGENYLLPGDIPAPQSGQRDFVKSEAISMTDLIGRIANSGARTRVFVIDACRDNPFEAAGVRSVGGTRGLARVEAPAGTFIMYSAGYRQQALDRLGPSDSEETSVYTRTLLNHLGKPGRAIDDIAQDVRREVQDMARSIGHDQRPAYYDELSARLVLVEPETGDDAPAQTVTSATTSPSQLGPAAEAWSVTKDTVSAAVLEAFISQFPGTIYAAFAEARLEELQAATGNEGTVAALGTATSGGTSSVAVELGLEADRLHDGGDYAEALEAARQAADLGDPVGMTVLGMLYANGRGIAEDDSEAVRWFRQAADTGNARAMYQLAISYDFGRGVIENDAEAVRWYRAAADGGSASGMNNLGVMYEHGNGIGEDDSEAVRWYRRAADAGNARGMTNLGVMYAYGRGIERDDYEAVRWYRLGADAGNARAMNNLGVMYEHGRGTLADAAEAVSWYQRAAEKGNVLAMTNLGVMYEFGRGIAENDDEAARWYTRAANEGNSRAMNNLGVLYEHGRGVARDEAEAVNWYRRAADLGHALAMKNLGVMYEYGRGVAEDHAEAVRWYRRGAEAGNVRAMTNLGVMYEYGRGIEEDDAEAVRWYRRAADDGHPRAMSNLGVMYANGRGVEQDHEEATRWYRLAADNGDLRAMHNLGVRLDGGIGAVRDSSAGAQLVFDALSRGYDFSRDQMVDNSGAYSVDFRREFQRLLRNAGVYDGAIDGEFGAGTRAAIEALVSR